MWTGSSDAWVPSTLSNFKKSSTVTWLPRLLWIGGGVGGRERVVVGNRLRGSGGHHGERRRRKEDERGDDSRTCPPRTPLVHGHLDDVRRLGSKRSTGP